jgi:outer membrane protein assembly factor BamB
VITSPAVAGGRVIFGTSDSSRYYVVDARAGKALVEQQGKAFMFSSPAVAGSVVLVGVLNGTLEAPDLGSGALL